MSDSRLLELARAMVRVAELAAEHAAVCPIEGACLKCDQLVADQVDAENGFKAEEQSVLSVVGAIEGGRFGMRCVGGSWEISDAHGQVLAFRPTPQDAVVALRKLVGA